MKKLILATSFALAAMIADPALAQPPSYNWSGAYIGGGIGRVTGEVDRFYPNFAVIHLPPMTFTTDGDDTIYGAHAGAMWQFGQWVVGMEAAYSRAANRIEGSVSVSPPEPFTTLSAISSIHHLFTVGPRVGYAWDRLLVFATGGYAVGKIRGAYTCTDTGQPVFPGPGACGTLFGPLATQDFTGTTWNGGWFVGGGFDYAVYSTSLVDVLLGVEYQHFELRRKVAFCFSPNCAVITMQDHVSFHHGAQGDIVRARLTIKTHGFGR